MTPSGYRVVRDEWNDDLVRQTAAIISPDAYHLLHHDLSNDEIFLAALVLHIVSHEAIGTPPEQTAYSLIAAGVAVSDVTIEEAVNGFVWPVLKHVRISGVPGPRWWDIHQLAVHILQLWVTSRLRVSHVDSVRAELGRLWDTRNPAVVDALLSIEPNPFAHWPRDAATEIIKQVEDDRLPRSAYLREIGRPDLADLYIVTKGLKSFVGTGIAPALRMIINGLTPYEVALLAEDDDLIYRDRCLNTGINIIEVFLLMRDALPDKAAVDRRAIAPKWMQEQIIGGGARLWHANAGPLPVWLVTAESDQDEAQFAYALTNQRGGIAIETTLDHVRLSLAADPLSGVLSDRLFAPFSYNLESTKGCWDALLLASAARVHVVLLRLAEDEQLYITGRHSLLLPDQVCDHLQREAVSGLHILAGENFDNMRQQLVSDRLTGIAEGTFLACERAKGEDLLDEISVDPPGAVPAQRWLEFKAASRALATCRAAAIRAEVDGDRLHSESAKAVEMAAQRRDIAKQRATARPSISNKAFVEEMIGGTLPDPHTAFLHFCLMEDPLDSNDEVISGVWLVDGLGKRNFGLLEFGYLKARDLSAAAARVSEPVGDFRRRAELIDGLHTYLARIGGPIAETLLPMGIRKLIISPVRPLDLLPLHAAPVSALDSGITLLDVFDEVVYAPSVRILKASLNINSRPGADFAPVLVSHAGNDNQRPLETRTETDVIQQIYPKATTIDGEDATPLSVLDAARTASLLHIACHGRIVPDRWANGLMLAGQRPADCLLSVADVLAQDGFPYLRLVILNACRSGTHQASNHGLHTPRGLDAAFHARGAQCVMSTLWEVADISSLAFSVALHLGLRDGKTPAAAHGIAIEFVRRGGSVGDDPIRAEAASKLDKSGVAWRKSLLSEASYGVWNWGSFKIMGIGWERR